MNKVLELLNSFNELTDEEKKAFLSVIQLKEIDVIKININTKSMDDSLKRLYENIQKTTPQDPYKGPFGDNPFRNTPTIMYATNR